MAFQTDMFPVQTSKIKQKKSETKHCLSTQSEVCELNSLRINVDEEFEIAEKEITLTILTPIQVFSCKIWEIFGNTYFEEYLQTTASSI